MQAGVYLVINVLVFPCGSEIGLEVFRSLRYIKDIHLFGASSVDDHGKFIYKHYISELPYFNDDNFESKIIEIVNNFNIDVIYPCMDLVSAKIMSMASKLNCVVIGSSEYTQLICNSKKETYKTLRESIRVPLLYKSPNAFPMFIKQDDGYGSRCGTLVNSEEEASIFITKNKDKHLILCEYLPGEEYTVDCFTNRYGELIFAGPRKRGRISNGISVRAEMVSDEVYVILKEWAVIINKVVSFSGAWFFQVRMDNSGCPCLLEIASRLAGSSSYHRLKGINFAYLSILDALGHNVRICPNDYTLELDRALDCRFTLDLVYDEIYVDLDDCLIINGKINVQLISFLFNALNSGKKIYLVTRHRFDLKATLDDYRLTNIFCGVFWLRNGEPKSDFIRSDKAIFIDDSFSERCEVKRTKNINVFSPDMVDGLI